MKKFSLLIASALTIIALDQASKIAIRAKMYLGESISIIDGLFNLWHVKNYGVAFGMGSNAHELIRTIFFLGLPVIACFVLTYLIWRGCKAESKATGLQLAAYTLILGGAVGNLLDRFLFGFVTDFLDFYWNSSHFATFNIADTSISIAAGLLILDFIIESRREYKKLRSS
ncbi:MAG: signal peptidase II [Oligoflexia bacterium]|nr:signal peptidase II [Oligoflexia bacterium]